MLHANFDWELRKYPENQHLIKLTPNVNEQHISVIKSMHSGCCTSAYLKEWTLVTKLVLRILKEVETFARLEWLLDPQRDSLGVGSFNFLAEHRHHVRWEKTPVFSWFKVTLMFPFHISMGYVIEWLRLQMCLCFKPFWPGREKTHNTWMSAVSSVNVMSVARHSHGLNLIFMITASKVQKRGRTTGWAAIIRWNLKIQVFLIELVLSVHWPHTLPLKSLLSMYVLVTWVYVVLWGFLLL